MFVFVCIYIFLLSFQFMSRTSPLMPYETGAYFTGALIVMCPADIDSGLLAEVAKSNTRVIFYCLIQQKYKRTLSYERLMWDGCVCKHLFIDKFTVTPHVTAGKKKASQFTMLMRTYLAWGTLNLQPVKRSHFASEGQFFFFLNLAFCR